MGTEVFAAHKDKDEELLMKQMIKNGYKVVITEIASDGLDESWVGETLTLENLEALKKLSKKYGFDLLGEGGYYNSLVVDGPIFSKKIEILNSEKVMEKNNSGYLKISNLILAEKESLARVVGF